jgi:hypothetical protein
MDSHKFPFLFLHPLNNVLSLYNQFFWQEKPPKKPAEIENYAPPVISVEHEDAIFLAEPFAETAVYEARQVQSICTNWAKGHSGST